MKGLQNFEIYALTWDDIFMMFELRHKFLIDNLQFDRKVIRAELMEKGIHLYNEEMSSSTLAHDIIDLSKITELVPKNA